MGFDMIVWGDWKPEIPDKERSETEPDLLPEYCHYKDEGCDLFPSCLNCPLPQCIYDQPRGKQRWLKALRNQEITRLFTNEGKGVKELALLFGTSQRTIQRVLKNSLSGSANGEGEKRYQRGNTE